MDNIYLATCIRLISHLGGSSIATVIVLEESPGPILLFVSIAMYFFSVITFHGDLYLYNVCLGSNKNILPLLLLTKFTNFHKTMQFI